jgi:hypothetical protein
MELCEGDLVWTNPIETLNAVCMACEGIVYKLIPYQDIYVAKRNLWIETTYFMSNDVKPGINGYSYYYPKMKEKKDKSETIMLNGYCLCEQVPRQSLSHLDVINNNKVEQTKGIVAYIGKPNRAHQRPEYSDFLDLKIGDEVLFDKKYTPFLLERQLYAAKFSQEKLYWCIPRRRIVAAVNRRA